MKQIGTITVVTACIVAQVCAFNTAFTVSTALDRKPISPYIYGMNFAGTAQTGLNLTLSRQGGDRMTCYNWETNASNGASYMNNVNDPFLVQSLPAAEKSIPGIVMIKFQDFNNLNKLKSIITIPIGGYVSADMNGQVTTPAPSSRFFPTYTTKGSAYTLTPNLSDGKVYTDEMVNLLIAKYGKANTATGVTFYQLDNEPNIWNTTHPMMHPLATGCYELLTKNIQTAAMIKRMDPYAMVIGPSICCSWSSFSDWNTVKGTHQWFPSWYLEKMKQASDSVGYRLVDVFDMHYPASNNKPGLNSIFTNVLDHINTYYPGTKFGVTEWTWGTGDNMNAALDVAFVLGMATRHGVYLHCWWGSTGNYVSAGFRIFRNYDGQRSTYGTTSVRAVGSGPDSLKSEIFASVDTLNQLHVILINKDTTASLNATVALNADRTYLNGTAYQLTGTAPSLIKLSTAVTVTNNSFAVTVPKKSVTHIVFTASTAVNGLPARVKSGTGCFVWSAPREKQIHYTVPFETAAAITITNAVGKIVKRLSSVSGTGTISIDRQDVSSGILFVSITSQGSAVHQKLVLVE